MIYVILPRDAIGEVMRGERTTLPVIDPAPIGATLAVKTARNRKPTVLLTVTACDPDPEGHTLTVRIRPLEHEPLLLAQDSSRGYTADPRLAMPREPEAVHLELLSERWAIRAGHKHDKAQAERSELARIARQQLDMEDRMRNARDAAKLNHVDVSSELDLVRKHIRSGRSEQSVTRRLETAERIAYRDAA